jgi:cellulose biosynthesis protein BcsQ
LRPGVAYNRWMTTPATARQASSRSTNGRRTRKPTKIALFNHKGGVGKTTLTVNIAEALADEGHTVLLVDADPQCNLTSFYLDEAKLEKMLQDSHGEAEGEEGETVWSAVKPVVDGRGGIAPIPEYSIRDDGKLFLLPGDVLLSEYEEVLPAAWTECFAQRTRGYDLTTALAQVVDRASRNVGATVCLYDVGPNVGALNRSVLLDCDYFITPVAADLFSLRALSTVGRALAKWIQDWKTIRGLASPTDLPALFGGMPAYLGYIASAFKVKVGRSAANPHEEWERKIAPRVHMRIIRELQKISPKLVPFSGDNKVGGVKHFHSLAPAAQAVGLPLGALRGYVNSGHYEQVDEAAAEFKALASEIAKRTGL